jgi:hypothetical protein
MMLAVVVVERVAKVVVGTVVIAAEVVVAPVEASGATDVTGAVTVVGDPARASVDADVDGELDLQPAASTIANTTSAPRNGGCSTSELEHAALNASPVEGPAAQPASRVTARHVPTR